MEQSESLNGVLIDLDKDEEFYNAALNSIFNRLNSSDRLIENELTRVFKFVSFMRGLLGMMPQ